MERNKLSEADAERRISVQLTNDERVSKSNILISTEWGEDVTTEQLDVAWKGALQRSQEQLLMAAPKSLAGWWQNGCFSLSMSPLATVNFCRLPTVGTCLCCIWLGIGEHVLQTNLCLVIIWLESDRLLLFFDHCVRSRSLERIDVRDRTRCGGVSRMVAEDPRRVHGTSPASGICFAKHKGDGSPEL
jgi:hypothetical protein